MATKIVDQKDKDKQKNIDDEKQSKAGIPKDWTLPPTIKQILTDIKFCDMSI